MVRVRQVAFLSFSVLLFAFNSGCASLGKCKFIYSEAPAGGAFLAVPTDFQSEASLLKWSGEVSESEKIDYLLDRIAISNHHFIRNGETYDGKITRRWLLHKMHHWVSGVDTAGEFVTRVANGSQKTGQPYLIEFPEGKFYSLQSVLRNELSFLEKQMTGLHPLGQDTIAKSNPVSLSSTAIAASAVATSVRPSNS